MCIFVLSAIFAMRREQQDTQKVLGLNLQDVGLGLETSTVLSPGTQYFEFCTSYRAWLVEDMSQVVKVNVEFITLKVRKPISYMVFTKMHFFKPNSAFS